MWLSRNSSAIVFLSAVMAAAGTAALASTAFLAIPNPIYDWAHASVSPVMGSTEAAVRACMGIFLAFAGSVAISAFANDRIPGRGGDLRFVVLFTAACFLAALLFEAVWHIPGDGGNLWASNPAGPTLEEGRLTTLGWMTAARRATLAGGIGLAMGAIFAGVRRLGAAQRR